MLRVFMLFTVLLAGCMGGEDVGGANVTGIRPGLYEARENLSYSGVFLELVSQITLKADGAYAGSMYIGNRPMIEAKGKWSQGGASLFYTEILAREANEDGTWGPWQAGNSESDQIRNVTPTSYQYYFDFEKAFSAEERAQIEGLQSGWRTCNRLSD